MKHREDAEELYQATIGADPFPNIPPALLNSADIHDYIETTGMVFPYDPNLMKSSSYEAQIGDIAIYWDQQGIKQTIKLDENSSVTLEPNSLVYFETKQEFRLPPYLAIRFNLRITNVHRGLLLGTGPLVDPGFCGKLLIPIHNLTNEKYTFERDEKFIWVEFTKVSPNKDWDSDTIRIKAQAGLCESFPKKKLWRTPASYFEKANDGNPINNAVPVALGEARKDSKKAMDRVKLITWSMAITALTFFFGLGPLLYASWDLSSNISNMISEFQTEYQNHIKPENLLEAKISALDKRIINLGNSIKFVAEKSEEQSEIKKQLDDMRRELEIFRNMVTQEILTPEKAN